MPVWTVLIIKHTKQTFSKVETEILAKMPIEIHGIVASAPCRIPYMTCEVLGLDYTMVTCDLQKGDHMKPEYLKINPQHTIPCMKDGHFCMNESRVMATYLVSKYGKDDKLYPKDTVTRAIVDQRLYFDTGVFYKSFGECVVSFPGTKQI